MKTETQRLQELMSRHWEGPMWHGGNLEDILSGIQWEKAFRKPVTGSHNIYEIVQHMLCWRKFVLEHLKGNTAYTVGLNSEEDWPTEYEKTEASWKEALAEMETNQKDLVKAFKGFKNPKLDEKVPGKKFTWRDFITGLIHHDIYHSAQISMLKK